MVRRTQSRRGVVILIVLSLLVLFVLLVVTFAIVAGQYRRAAQAVGRREWLGEDPQKTADRVMYTLLREPDVNHTGSPFRGHALLTDVYGRFYKGTVTGTAVSRAGGQIVEFNFLYPSSWSVQPNEKLRGYFNGSVLTFVSTSATSQLLQGVSTRVVAYAYTPASPPNPEYGTVRIVNPQNNGTALPLPQSGDTFVLNGKPFVGTGFAYNSAAASGTPQLSDDALKPNRWGDSSATLGTWLTGGANESYDAADYQNMVLAASAYDPARGSTRVLPSFHREELIAYWMARDTSATDTAGWNMLGGTSNTRYTDTAAISLPPASPTNIYSNLSAANFDLRHKLVFRPMPWDHPNFTGSNVAFDASSRSAQQIDDALTKGWVDLNANGTFDPNEVAWDVDNDGDGIKDSIWIDPDLPIQTTEDGRVFRPLVAILCVDMDGRLNVNAHGNYAHTTTLSTLVSVGLPGSVSSATFPKGQGYGPPEVNLNGVIGSTTEYQTLLQARYGSDGFPGHSGYDALMPFKFYEYPGNYFSANFWLSTYFNRTTTPATPFQALGAFNGNMDLRGVFASGVDYRGQPLYEFLYDSTTTPASYPDQLADSPYELNLNNASAADTPFTVAELEKVLRYRDFDASSLQSRLTDLSGLTFLRNNATARRAVTTDSWDIPVPGVVRPEGYPFSTLGTSNPPQSIMEVLADRLSANGVAVANLNAEIAKMLSPDLMMGLRMDINRPIGNGRDDNGNGVVDEAYGVGAIAGLNESLGPEYAKNGAVNIMTIDHDNDGTISGDTDAHLARGYLARHLYVLLMLLKDPTYQVSEDVDGDGNVDAQDTAQMLAQWAINAVDFRDADSTMTPFEYDYNPFDGWVVDGNVLTNEAADGVDNDGDGATDDAKEQERRVVWGSERPELLISETLAFHDRRTEDLTTDPEGQLTTDPAPDNDGDFDQRLAPRGALFVELYNPWSGHDKWPAEFYHTGAAWSSGVLLNKTNAAGQPVWRLAITDSDDEGYLDPDPISLTMPDPERTVYFANPTGLTGGTNLGIQQHFTTVAAANIAPLLPGRYAVVGTAGVPSGSSYVTTIGRRTDAGDSGSTPAANLETDITRQIRLTPSGDPNVNQVEVRNNLAPPALGGTAVVDSPMDSFASPPALVQPAIAIPIDVVLTAGTSKGKGKGKGKGGAGTDDIWLSVSEPIGGYEDVYGSSIWDPSLADGEGAYEPPRDEPIDNGTLPLTNGTLSNHRRIHLQRLANPLAPYDAITNPYLTIDVMPVDLTVFNGAEAPSLLDPSIALVDNKFGCFQRGANNAATDRFLWRHEDSTFDLVAPTPVGLHRFDFVLRQTLGYLNSSYGTAIIPGTAPTAPPFAVTSYVGAPYVDATAPSFPWLTWNNRPYASPTELLLVPRGNPSHLLSDFSIADATVSPYDPTQQGRFRQLLNLFAVDVGPNDAPNLYRLFEYLTVEPRFAGTETRFNPSTAVPHFGSTATGTEMLHPPFNWISSYREPGRINLNTIFPTHVDAGSGTLLSGVWDGLWGAHQALPLATFVDNRRGYGAAGGNAFTASSSSAVPTYFANPYRATGSALLVPPDGDGDADPTELARLEVDASLLRTNRATMGLPTTLTASDLPQYMNAFTNTASDARDISRRSDRNPYFSYQALQRLSNLVTCRSNVYALWLTIGYFEWEYDPTNSRWQLGQEVGIDTGTVRRHRAFYIIDRTIPVAFEPGQNHNVDKCVLLRRFIE